VEKHSVDSISADTIDRFLQPSAQEIRRQAMRGIGGHRIAGLRDQEEIELRAFAHDLADQLLGLPAGIGRRGVDQGAARAQGVHQRRAVLRGAHRDAIGAEADPADVVELDHPRRRSVRLAGSGAQVAGDQVRVQLLEHRHELVDPDAGGLVDPRVALHEGAAAKHAQNALEPFRSRRLLELVDGHLVQCRMSICHFDSFPEK